jgi:hypothetical protein
LQFYISPKIPANVLRKFFIVSSPSSEFCVILGLCEGFCGIGLEFCGTLIFCCCCGGLGGGCCCIGLDCSGICDWDESDEFCVGVSLPWDCEIWPLGGPGKLLLTSGLGVVLEVDDEDCIDAIDDELVDGVDKPTALILLLLFCEIFVAFIGELFCVVDFIWLLSGGTCWLLNLVGDAVRLFGTFGNCLLLSIAENEVCGELFNDTDETFCLLKSLFEIWFWSLWTWVLKF